MTANSKFQARAEGYETALQQHRRKHKKEGLMRRRLLARIPSVASSTDGARTRSCALCGALAVFTLLALAPAAAQAAQARLFAGSFGQATSTPPDPYPLGGSRAVAVDPASHDVYVADGGKQRVEKFKPDGEFLSMIGSKVNKTAVSESRPQAEQDVCPAQPGDECQAGAEGSTPGAFETPAFLAVDGSSNLYVGDLGHATNEKQSVTISATGGTFTLSFKGKTTGPINFNAPVASGGGNVLFALSALGEGFHLYGSPGAYQVEFEAENGGLDVPQLTCDASALSGAGHSCEVATLIQGSSTARVEKFDSSGQPISSWANGGQLDGSAVTDPPAPIAGPFSQLNGIAVDPSGNLWVSAGRGNETTLKTFEFGSGANFLSEPDRV